MEIKNDTELKICTGDSRKSKHWKNRVTTWTKLAERCSNTKRTKETVEAFKSMAKCEAKSDIKDVGGFVGGTLKTDGQRNKNCMASRQVITLDADNLKADSNIWDDFTIQYNNAALVYSTHSHTAKNPRLRIIIPLKSEVTCDECEAVARYIANEIGLEQFDKTTFESNRLMFWPSTPSDGDFIFNIQDGPILNPDDILKLYDEPTNPLTWPRHKEETPGAILLKRLKVPDPKEKPGEIGLFCRAYSIDEALTELLTDVYEPTKDPNRYTYKAGTSYGGLCVYPQDGYVISYHSTDPANIDGHECNAFDLVRIHKYGNLDEEAKPGTPANKLPSYIAMQGFIQSNDKCKRLQAKEQAKEVSADFDSIDLEKDDAPEWFVNLERDRKGHICDTDKNRVNIMLNDKKLKAIRFNEFSGCDIITDTESDFLSTRGNAVDDYSLSRIAGYAETVYGLRMNKKGVKEKLLERTANERGFNPVKEFITAKKWDGVKRCETLLIDYLGAEDTALNRAVTRKWLTAAVARVFSPGCKFDFVLTLQGPEGIGKSTLLNTLAGTWFCDSFSLTMKESRKYEIAAMAWIIEIPELNGMDKATVESAKAFISSTNDKYRRAYAVSVEENPRHCVFAASTNEAFFLKGDTGNRRWWIVPLNGKASPDYWIDSLKADVSQIWAEAYQYYLDGEKLFLNTNLEKEARDKQAKFNTAEGDPLLPALRDWLNIKLPTDWDTWSKRRRQAYYANPDPLDEDGIVTRMSICALEVKDLFPFAEIRNYSPQRVNQMLLRCEEWEKPNGYIFIPGYGKQRGYTRIIKEDKDDEEI